MRSSCIVSVLSTLSSLAAALPASAQHDSRAVLFTGQPFQITNMVIEALPANTTLSFDVHDPDPLTNTTTSCSGSWIGNSGYPSGSYLSCIQDTSYAWNMYSYTNATEFVLGIEHAFTDPSVGEYPYDQVITFAKISINETVLECGSFILGTVTLCAQASDSVLQAPIYATIA